MKINDIIAELNVVRSNNCSPEKSEEIKQSINELLPYGELDRLDAEVMKMFKTIPPVNLDYFINTTWEEYKESFGDVPTILSKEWFDTMKEWCKKCKQ